MKRRDFLKNTSTAVAIPAIIGGYSVKAFANESPLGMLFGMAEDTDHVLVLIQLNGGNDGLNTVIPLDIYSNYYNARTNIAIPQAKALKLNAATGLNPAMTGMQSLFADGKLNIVQAVGYPTPNFSHFRATDIWMSASDSDQYVSTGWAGRYLNQQYPNYPNGYPNSTMTDPLGIQIGSVTSMAFQGPAVSMGLSISDPTSFYNLVNNITDPVPNTPSGKEISYLRTVARQTQQYAGTITAAAAKVTTQATYPANNTLADQLKIVAKLIKGGLRTRVYMVSMGSFDTHSAQTETDTTTGGHAVLLKTLSDGIKAFQDDLKFLGIEERVIGMTFSEFGRRIKSNASVGTDHGAAAPVFMFGKNIVGGVTGTSPAIPVTATTSDNIPFQYDFRSVYATILQNWFCLDSTTIQGLLLKNFQNLNIINNAGCVAPSLNRSGITTVRNYPNPFQGATTIEFTTTGGHTMVQIIDMEGRAIRVLTDKVYDGPATDKVVFNAGNLPAGSYYARLQNGASTQVCLMMNVGVGGVGR